MHSSALVPGSWTRWQELWAALSNPCLLVWFSCTTIVSHFKVPSWIVFQHIVYFGFEI